MAQPTSNLKRPLGVTTIVLVNILVWLTTEGVWVFLLLSIFGLWKMKTWG